MVKLPMAAVRIAADMAVALVLGLAIGVVPNGLTCAYLARRPMLGRGR